MAATSSADVWALVGKGRVVATHDAGLHWEVQAIPGPVGQLATVGSVVWAMSCSDATSRTSAESCRPQLWRTRSANSWKRLALPRVTAEDPSSVQFAITASGDVIVNVIEARARPPFGELLVSHDDGVRWIRRPPPRWREHNECGEWRPAILTTVSLRTFWLLCLGQGAAGSSSKVLLRSTDAGRSWATVSAVSLDQRFRPGEIPGEEPSDLAAGSHTMLWLSLTNNLAETNDGGRHWTYVPTRAVDTRGLPTVLDALSASHAWLLALGARLWHTTDGLHWRALGPLNTG
ncbi:MAG TPA: hypothetical protein VG365_16795 [Solirubrobacteraceae bacterium]|nr:hypothetical protein [Solirubrobacteraceae bacterium]